MSEPTPELRALAATLFDAGRAERPAPALGRRLMLIEPLPIEPLLIEPLPIERPGADSTAPQQSPPGADEYTAASRRRLLAPSRRAFWFAAAALLAGGIGAGFALAPEPQSIAISAERGTSTAHTAAREPSSAVAAEAVSTAQPRASMTARSESERVEADTKPHAIGARTPGLRHEEPPAGDARARAAERRPPVPGTPAKAPAKTRVASARGPTTAAIEGAPVETPALASKRADAASSETSSRAAPRRLTLRDELQLLGQARTRLRAGEAAHALELLEQHARERDSRGLDAEATLLRIETYAALGRHDEASALAARFVRDNPNSALGDRAQSFIRSAPAAPTP